ncbi:MAG: ribonuclease HII [Oscillospiraceae bacterium]|nr:ribonuclease HII [Oscillospiraceae bacterium]
MSLYEFDREEYARGFDVICGADEAGRGPLAGPVFAAAVILPREEEIEGLNDSKKLTEKRREKLYDEIVSRAVSWSVQRVDAEEIDRINILQASLLAMKRAIEALSPTPDMAYIDGNRTPELELIPAQAVVKGDGRSACIAAASILAKVSRDRYMLELHRQYPMYGFDKHKGYPTRLHYEMLGRYGVSPVHRKSFLKNLREHLEKSHG